MLQWYKHQKTDKRGIPDYIYSLSFDMLYEIDDIVDTFETLKTIKCISNTRKNRFFRAYINRNNTNFFELKIVLNNDNSVIYLLEELSIAKKLAELILKNYLSQIHNVTNKEFLIIDPNIITISKEVEI